MAIDIVVNGVQYNGVVSIVMRTPSGKAITFYPEEVGSYTNLLPLAIDADGKIYDAADGKPGYKSGVRLSSSGVDTTATTFDTTGYIPCKLGDIVRMRGINYSPTATNASNHRICFYKADKTYIQLSQASTPSSTPDPNLDGVYNSDNKLVQFTVKNYATVDLTDVAYFRICSDTFDDEPIITVNEEITEGGNEPKYTNWLDSVEVTADTYLSSSSGSTSAKTGYSSTGFIPIGIGSKNSARGEQVIRLQGINALKGDNYVRVLLYDADKNFIIAHNASATAVWKSVEEDTGAALVIYELDSDGRIVSFDYSGYNYFLSTDANYSTPAYFRFCAPTWGDDAIITVNEEITDEGGANYTNLVPISIDTDGSIYNGVGYKDNVRLSSSGGVSSSAQTNSVTTGFMPFKNTDIIRIKGAEWLDATANYGGHFYFNLYDSNKAVITTGVMASSDYSVSEGFKSQVSITYDAATDVTTFQIIDPDGATGSFRAAAKNAAYFRINAYGKGAGLIVTVNEEIT